MESIIVEKEYGHNFFTSNFMIVELVDCAWWTTNTQTHYSFSNTHGVMVNQLSNYEI